MSTLIVRVELHGPIKDYNQLHQWMRAQGFSTTIMGSDRSVYHLPTAIYQIVGDYTPLGLADWLRANMPKCGSMPDPWIFVSRGDDAAWANLPKTSMAA